MIEPSNRDGASPPAAVGATRIMPLALLAERGYRGIWIAGACIHGVRWIEVLAVSVFVFALTASAFDVSLTMFARFVPMALLGGVLGSLATVLDRRWLLVAGLALVAVARAVLGILVIVEAIEFWHVVLGMVLAGIIDANEYPVRRALAVDYAGPDRTASGLALDQMTNVATLALGPLVGGLLVDGVGIQGAYFTGALVSGLGVLAACRLPPVAPVADSRPTGFRASLVDGFSYVRSQRVIVGALAITVFFNFFGWPYTAMVPVIGKDHLGLSAGPIGLLMSAPGIGAFLATLVMAVRPPRSLPRAYFVGSTLYFATILVFSTSPWYEVSLAILFVAGLGLAGFSVNQAAIVFLSAEPAFRSRATGLLTMCIGTGPFGMLHVGALADWLGAPAAVAVIAAEGLVAMGAVYVLWPEFHRKT